MGGGFLQKLTEGASILACLSWGHWLTSGHMSTSRWCFDHHRAGWTDPCHHRANHSDQLMPGLVPLLLTFACMWLLAKKLTRCGSSLASSSSVSLVRLRPAGTVRLLYTTGAFWPVFLSGGLMTITDLVLILFIAHSWPSRSTISSSCPAVTAPPAGNSFAPAWSHR